MKKSSYLVQKTRNRLLDKLEAVLASGSSYLPSDLALAAELGVSRTTLRAAQEPLFDRGLIARDGGGKRALRRPAKGDYCDIASAPASREEVVRKYFLSLIHEGRLLPGSRFSELELARQSGCNTVTVREFLVRFSRFGLIEKKPRSQWQMVEFDARFARELVEFRKVLEMRALVKLLDCDDRHPVWRELRALLAGHQAVQRDFDRRYAEVPALDARLHQALQMAMDNRFASQFFELVSFVCHYHYQWHKAGEKARLRVAVDEHIDLLLATLARDAAGAIRALELHLETAERTLLECATCIRRAGADAARA